MRLMAYWICPYQGLLDIRQGRRAKCRVRIFEHEANETPGAPVLLLTDLADNEGEDISSAAEVLVGTLLAVLQEMVDLSVCTAPIFINHYPPEVSGAGDLYELIDFDQPEIVQLVIEEREAGASSESTGHRVVWSLEEARFVPADKSMVEALVGSGP